MKMTKKEHFAVLSLKFGSCWIRKQAETTLMAIFTLVSCNTYLLLETYITQQKQFN